MKQDVLQQAAEYTQRHHRNKRRKRAVTCLAAAVVFCTTYALILPAITMENTCQLPEHTHSETCYTQAVTVPPGVPVCTLEHLNIHRHTADCYNGDSEPVCGCADFVIHQHDASCYDEDGNLWCPLPEIEAHTHTPACYTEQRTLLCGEEECEPEHLHTDECVQTETVLTCEKEEIILHTHGESCFDETGNPVCGQVEVLEHRHTDACFQTVEAEPELICGLTEHTHTEDCFPPEPPQAGEELAQVREVIARIDALPTSDEANEILAAFDAARDYARYEAYLTEVQSQINAAYDAYDALSDDEKAYVANADKLTQLDWLLHAQAVYEDPPLEEDDAFVSQLTAAGVEISSHTASAPAAPMTVCNQDTISYTFFVRTESYSNTRYGEGRVKLEFVLPLSMEQAVFDVSAMTWLDQSAGYAPVLTTETRMIGDTALPCQVLTGYKLLLPQADHGSAIPGELTEAVSVTVRNMANGEHVAVQISAAMEYGAWDGGCETHRAEEKLTVVTDPLPVLNRLSAEEQQAVYDRFLAEIETLEAFGALDPDMRMAAEDLRSRLLDAYKQGELSEEDHTELQERLCRLFEVAVSSIAEAAEGTNWMLLRDSGWFEAYSSYANADTGGAISSRALEARSSQAAPAAAALAGEEAADAPASDVQVEDRGGTAVSAEKAVSVSKTISGTDLENVFDITLQVQTSMNVAEIYEEPDMAVVIVMDISNTMNSNFGGVSRYAAAMAAAEEFLDEFAANNSLGISKVGYVAFNTDAHQIFGLQSCTNADQAGALKHTMRTETGAIINADGYSAAHSRFTNVEAGLKMASDMLNSVSNKNKYIIFLSDGFPTTYISSGYSGYDPYTPSGTVGADGVFYDSVLGVYCVSGTSYSDKAAIRARSMAASIKASGTTIFSIGVDVAGQTIQKYITQSEGFQTFSLVDRTGTSYEIGDASSTEAYKSWLRNSIGSGYYYDSTDSAGLAAAYDQIFEQIRHLVAAGSQADWVTNDPLPTLFGSLDAIEFIGFFNKAHELVSGDLTGTNALYGENTAAFQDESSGIIWNLKRSGYQSSTEGNATTYTYQLVYRVRLKNENADFTEGNIYSTNGTTTLQYRNIESTDGNMVISDPKTVDFPIPSVHGFLSELTFTKTDVYGQPLAGAGFTLCHDTDQCSVCRGDGSSAVEIPDMSAVSNADGTVSFEKVPSGHKYRLMETVVPDGYSSNGNTYQVEVAYDTITVTVTAPGGTVEEWAGEIANRMYYELPQTGGAGTFWYAAGGLSLMALACLMYQKRKTHRRKGSF